VQKVKAKPEPKPEPKATLPQVKKLTPETETIDDTDAIDRTGNYSAGGATGVTAGGTAGGAADSAAGSTPAPTNSAPSVPGQTFTGKARFSRIRELSEPIATKLIEQISREMKVAIPATEAYDGLVKSIIDELEYFVTGKEF
jgi:hypothetical protein